MSASIKETLGLEKGSTEVAKKPKDKQQASSLRLELVLTQPTVDVFPEFSYARLVEKELSTNKDGAEPFAGGEQDEAQKIADIARRLEQKYGGGSKSKKRKRLVYDEDLIDKSSGYDESDSFVDNSEAFDDYVPEGYEPQHGGFYINDGELFFKSVTSDDEDSRSMPPADSGDFAPPKKIKHAKSQEKVHHRTGADGEPRPGRGRGRGSSLTHKTQKSPVKRPEGTGAPRGRPRKITTTKLGGLMKTPATVTSTSAVPTPGAATNQQQQSTLLPSTPTKVASTSPPAAASAGYASDGRQPIAQNTSQSSPRKSPTKTLVTQSSEERMDTDDASSPSFEHPGSSAIPDDGPFSEDFSQSQTTELPEGLPPDLVQFIHSFRKGILSGSIETACVKNLDSTYDAMLLEIETKLHNKVKGKRRQAVYAHLSSFLPHSKESLQRRAKKVNIANEEVSLEGPLARLLAAVELQMPEQQERYKEEVRRAVEAHKKASSMTDEAAAAASDSTIGSGGEDEADSSLISALQSPTHKPQEEAKTKKFRPPNKKFQWTVETRSLLCEAVQAKVEGLRATMQRIVGGVDSIKQFLEQRVKPAWPDSWMSVNILFRESRQAHLRLTNPVQYKQLQGPAKSGRGPRPYVRSKTKSAPGLNLSSIKTSDNGSMAGPQPQSTAGTGDTCDGSVSTANIPSSPPPLTPDTVMEASAGSHKVTQPPQQPHFQQVRSPTRTVSSPVKLESARPLAPPAAAPPPPVQRAQAPKIMSPMNRAAQQSSSRSILSAPKLHSSSMSRTVSAIGAMPKSLPNAAGNVLNSKAGPSKSHKSAGTSTPSKKMLESGHQRSKVPAQGKATLQHASHASTPAMKQMEVQLRKSTSLLATSNAVQHSIKKTTIPLSKSSEDLRMGSPPRHGSSIPPIADVSPKKFQRPSAFHQPGQQAPVGVITPNRTVATAGAVPQPSKPNSTTVHQQVRPVSASSRKASSASRTVPVTGSKRSKQGQQVAALPSAAGHHHQQYAPGMVPLASTALAPVHYQDQQQQQQHQHKARRSSASAHAAVTSGALPATNWQQQQPATSAHHQHTTTRNPRQN
ncbi:ubinuclein-1-like isoform X2 [Sycon ciliatum]|uniref:ubinuclein-1-like isoform X2 n=1 Tax=Sycon ciliatum TaxID=27933 RepID=UPI0031F61699